MKKSLLLAAVWCVAASVVGCAAGGGAAESARETVVVVVRHAEKASVGRDPGLTSAGRARAEELALICEGEGVTSVFSTAYARTRETAGPTAARVGAVVDTSFGPGAEGALASHVRGALAGRASLVVGHSNTVAAIVEALGAARPEAIGEDVYDRLYVVRIGGDGVARVESRRYGAATP